MIWTARIIVLWVAGLILIGVIGGALDDELSLGIRGMILVVIGGIALAGGIVSWRRERLAGILLVLAAMAMGIHTAAFTARFFDWLMLGFPFLVAGLLFLNSWRLSRRTA